MKMKMKKSFKKQAGVSLVEVLIVPGVAGTVMAGVAGLGSKAMAGVKVNKLEGDVNLIFSAASSWGGMNKSDISMTELCKGYLNKEICGDSQGVASNPFGGNYSIAVNDGNVSQVKVGIEGIDVDSVTVVGDRVAKMVGCEVAVGCAAITITANAIEVTR